jgi:hypothetical protein
MRHTRCIWSIASCSWRPKSPDFQGLTGSCCANGVHNVALQSSTTTRRPHERSSLLCVHSECDRKRTIAHAPLFVHCASGWIRAGDSSGLVWSCCICMHAHTCTNAQKYSINQPINKLHSAQCFSDCIHPLSDRRACTPFPSSSLFLPSRFIA